MAGRLLRQGMANVVEGVVGLLMAALCLTVLAGVVSRYIVGRPLAWSEEVARYLFLWISFLGAAVAVRRRANFKLDLITWRGTLRSRAAFELGGNLFTIIFGLLLAYWSIPLIQLASLQRGSAVAIPLSWVYIALPVGGLLMAVFAARRIWDDVKALQGQPTADFDQPLVPAGHGGPAAGPAMPE
jgi:TRAP-type C4-dicarboxylate transport system permease small subunit